MSAADRTEYTGAFLFCRRTGGRKLLRWCTGADIPVLGRTARLAALCVGGTGRSFLIILARKLQNAIIGGENCV